MVRVTSEGGTEYRVNGGDVDARSPPSVPGLPLETALSGMHSDATLAEPHVTTLAVSPGRMSINSAYSGPPDAEDGWASASCAAAPGGWDTSSEADELADFHIDRFPALDAVWHTSPSTRTVLCLSALVTTVKMLVLALVLFICNSSLIALWFYVDLRFTIDLSKRSAGFQWGSFLFVTGAQTFIHFLPIFFSVFMFGSDARPRRWSLLRTIYATEVVIIQPIVHLVLFLTGNFSARTYPTSLLFVFLLVYTGWSYTSVMDNTIKRWQRFLASTGPMLLGFASLYGFRFLVFPQYIGATGSAEKTVVITVMIPIYMVMLTTMGRVMNYSMSGNHPGTSWCTSALLQGVLSLCTRALIAGLSDLSSVALVSIVFGLVEFVGRSTLRLRERMWGSLFVRKGARKSFFSDSRPRKMRFLTDQVLSEMFIEFWGVLFAGVLNPVARWLLVPGAVISISFEASAIGIQLAIEIMFDMASCFVEESFLHYPISEVFYRRQRDFALLFGYVTTAAVLYLTPVFIDVIVNDAAVNQL